MAIITVAEVKVFLSISGTDKDALITALIPEVQGAIVAYCNRTFLDTAGDESWPSGIKLVAAKMVNHNIKNINSIGLSSESQGGYSYSKGSSDNAEYPMEILAGLNKWRYMKLTFGQKMSKAMDRRGIGLSAISSGDFVYGEEGLPYEEQ